MSVIQQFRQQARFGERWGSQPLALYGADADVALRTVSCYVRCWSLFSALVLCGLLMLFGLTTRGTIEWGYCTRLSVTSDALTNR